MAEPILTADSPTTPAEEHCAQCGRLLTPGDRVASGDRLFCRACHETLRAELETAIHAMSTDIPWLNAALGAVLGGVAGALAWWGFTVVTRLAIGFLAVGIGFAVGWATVKFAGGKRSRGLQALSVAVAVVSFLAASYLVNMTFINRTLAAQGEPRHLDLVPRSFEFFVRVVSLNFGLMDLVFLAIVVYEAWKIPAPVRVPWVSSNA